MSRSTIQEGTVSYGGSPPQIMKPLPLVTKHVILEGVVRQAGTTQTIESEVIGG